MFSKRTRAVEAVPEVTVYEVRNQRGSVQPFPKGRDRRYLLIAVVIVYHNRNSIDVVVSPFEGKF